MSTAALYLARAGRHACFDRVVLDINGSAATGFVVRYVPVVTSDAKGDPVPVPGRADLQVIVRAPITDDAGHQPWSPVLRVGDDMIAVEKLTGFPSVAAVRFAGSFEGQTTIAVGVQQRRPFRVWEYGDQHYRHIVVDVAH